MKKIMNGIISLIFIINTILFIISFSIACVILFRPFYYYQIKSLNLVEETNYSYKEIKEAYDDVIDYTVFNKKFSTGKLKYSKEGKSHFKDCKRLFMINFIILGLSIIIIILKKIFFNKFKVFKHSPEYWSSIIILISFISIIITALIIGFNKCFVIFHELLFAGKDNWLFDPDVDEIINILPIEYFMNCAILIVIIIFIISISIIIKELIHKEEKI